MRFSFPYTYRLAFMSACLVAVFSCAEKNEYFPPSEIFMGVDTIRYSESDYLNVIAVPVFVDKAQPNLIQSNFSLSYPDSSTHIDPDYYYPFIDLDFALTGNFWGSRNNTIGEDTLVNIYGDQRLGHILFTIIDDSIADGNDTVNVSLTQARGNSQLAENEARLTTTVIIEDDDIVPSDELRIHLCWGENGSRAVADENHFEFAVELWSEVTFTDSQATSRKIYRASRGTGEFLNLIMTTNDTDQDYYIAVVYVAHSPIVTGNVWALLKLNGLGFADVTGSNKFSAEFPAHETNYYSLYGPFGKTGNTVVFKGN